ncbi:MAG TPA: hypothetical protein VFL94_14750 [Actinomycetales bacterium]|nr:hypothetical protein [Actinomycetales bacterium]
MLDMMRGYLSLAAGLGQVSRRRALDAARELVEGSPLGGLSGGGPEAVAAQVSAVAEELMTIGRQNRRLLTQLVRTETQAVLASMGTGGDGHDRARHDHAASSRLDEQLQALRERVDELERQLKAGAAETPAARPVAGRTHGGPSSAAGATTAGMSRRPVKSATRRRAATPAATRVAATAPSSAKASGRKASATKASATKASATKASATKARGAVPSPRPVRRPGSGAGS